VPLTVIVDGPPALFRDLPRSIRDGAQVYALDASGDVLSIDASRSTGGVRFDDGTEVRFPLATDVCIRPGGCVCPDGTGPPTTASSGRAFVGLGPFELSPPDVTSTTLEEWCEETESTTTSTLPPPDPESCHVGSWVTTRYELPILPDAATATGGQGVRVTFGSDGSFLADYSAMVPIVSSAEPVDAPPITFTVTFSGALAGTWTTGDAGQLLVSAPTDSVHVTAVAEIGGNSTTVIDGSLAELSTDLGAPVFTVADCSGDTMRITNGAPSFSQTLTLTRD
jgi:hypothetical protein